MDDNTLAAHLGIWSVGPGPLHRKLAAALADCIARGALPPGVLLPSERTLAGALCISRTTVVTAYDALRHGGWLESRTGSGTWVCESSREVAAARSTAHSAALAASPVFSLLSGHQAADVIDFSLGSPFPLEGLSPEAFALPQEEFAALIHDRLHYPLGYPSTRHAVARYYDRLGLPTKPEQVLITNGALHAISLCTALYVQQGDTVLVEDPGFFGALDCFRFSGARISSLPVAAATGVSSALLRDRIIATAARLVYLTPTYQNPTGAVMPASARREVARIALELDVPIIDDGVMSELALDGAAHPLIAAFAPGAPILTVASLSKLTWPGLRIGWIRAPEPLIERLGRLRSAHDLGSPLLTQAITNRLLSRIDDLRRLRRGQLKPRRNLMASLLHAALPAWKFRIPPGSLFFWTRLPAGDAREFAQVALRHGVLILPGPAMSATEQHSRFIRLPFLSDSETLRRGVRRLAAAWKDYQSETRSRPAPPGMV